MDERMRILDLIETGQIGVNEGVRRLEELDEGEPGSAGRLAEEPTPAAQSAPAKQPPVGPAMKRVLKVAWQIVFGLGVSILAGGGLLLARAYTREGMPGIAWGWGLFVLGVVVTGLGWWLARARWLYLRVREHEGVAFTLALPVPLGAAVWLLRVARPFVPRLRQMDADGLASAMRDELNRGHPVAIEVDEGEAGDHVEIYFF